ncbi:unnamed protein product [Brugia pahangi]|uniref:Neur_chan_LBD domain-containing protein n=1 Tax=Brugia pahangi TaxID=6280 RepID=A0A0N4TEN6_BRUPA|nr:unnamed protein product [Brugia pahangi]
MRIVTSLFMIVDIQHTSVVYMSLIQMDKQLWRVDVPCVMGCIYMENVSSLWILLEIILPKKSRIENLKYCDIADKTKYKEPKEEGNSSVDGDTFDSEKLKKENEKTKT